MDCRQVCQLLSEYTDGFLPKETVEQVEAHLKNCDACRNEAEAFLALRKEIRALRIENTDDFVFDIERVKKPVSVPFMRRGWVRSLSAVAACLVLFIGIYAAVDHGYHTPGEDDLTLYVADAVQDTSAPKPAFGQVEDAKEENNEKQREITPKTAAAQKKQAPEIVKDEATTNVVINENTAAARVIVTEEKPIGTQSVKEVHEEAAMALSKASAEDLKDTDTEQVETNAEPERASGGGSSATARPASGGSASGIIPAPTYTKRTVTLSVSPEAQEMFSYILSAMPITGANGETLIGESDLSLLLRVDGVQIVSDQTVECDSENYLNKVVLIY